MSITATVDGTAYSGINTITAGGKTIALAESGGSASLGNLTEYNTVTQTVEETSADYNPIVVAHGLTQAPKIIIMHINKTFDTSYKSMIVGFIASVGVNSNEYGALITTNPSTGAINSTPMERKDSLNGHNGYIVDSTNLTLARGINAYHFDSEETYTFEFYA